MRILQALPTLVLTSLLVLVLAGGQQADAQTVRVEGGGGWAIPSSTVDMTGTVQGSRVRTQVNPGSGLNGYGFVGLEWTVSSNFVLGVGVRAQHSSMPGDAQDLLGRCEVCTASNDPDGHLRTATVEGRIRLVSVGRIKPYFLVGLGVVRTRVNAAEVSVPVEDASEDAIVQFSEVAVTDAGGDVGFGALMSVTGGLALIAEIRAAGSLPGAKENAVTTFPFTLGLSYGF